jgi:hypothetical protein
MYRRVKDFLCMRNFDHIPSNTTQEHIRDAVIEYGIHQINHPYRDSTDYDVIIDDMAYPPVAIMGIATVIANGGLECPKLKGGDGTPCFKKYNELGFKIVPKGHHSTIERNPKDSLSWHEYLNHLRDRYIFDPVNLLSFCLRLQPRRSINRFLGRNEDGPKELGPKRDHFSVGGKDWFNRIQVAFTQTNLKLYLVSQGFQREQHKKVRSEMDNYFRSNYLEPLIWPSTGPLGDGIQDLDASNSWASYVSVSTEKQCQSVLSWLSAGQNLEAVNLRFANSKSSLLKKEKPELFETTSDLISLELKTVKLLAEGLDEEPEGSLNPERSDPSETKGAFKRDPAVIAWVKQRANGICELCETDAPFLDKYGNPFLEVHHIIPLADKGPDKVDNAVALCPNCHRECHHGGNATSLSKSLSEKLSRST